MKLQNKKTFAFIVAATMSLSAVTALAETEPIEPIDAPLEDVQLLPFYGSYTGIVKDVTERENGTIFVELESEERGPSNFVITEKTNLIDNLEVEKGQTLIGFFENNRPMIMIYPPQYNVSVVVEEQEDLFVKADKFDKNLVSADNMLKLNISEETQVLWENGTEIDFETTPSPKEMSEILGDRKLVVFYDVSTRSIPAQTVPKKVVVLSGKESEPVGDVSTFDIEVNNEVIDAPHPFKTDDHTMVPLRAVAEGLGFTISWDEESQSVTVDNYATLTIGSNEYRAYDTDLELDIAPVIQNGFTYVSMDVFKMIIPTYRADVFEGRIIFE